MPQQSHSGRDNGGPAKLNIIKEMRSGATTHRASRLPRPRRARQISPYGPLQTGNVLIRPGIYIPAGSPADKWWNIGVRIEDDALITATGC
jgi:Xaa-Pro aminopeptidase